MLPEHVEVVVVGAGQAGLATSEHLSANGLTHVVLERSRIAERWRTERWDSLVANGPAWHDRFPNRMHDCAPDAFPAKDDVAAYFAGYAAQIAAPVHTGVEVTGVTRLAGRPGFRVDTSAGSVTADYVVAATGPFQRPLIPATIPPEAGVTQLHSNAYRNPGQLPPGGVLVIGAGSSGAQIAEELMDAGRDVYLSVAAHGRPPRRYRQRDFVWWLGVLNKWDMEWVPGTSHVTIAVSGADGGRTVDYRRFAERGMTLVGTTRACTDGVVTFAPDLAANLAAGDADYLGLLDEADAYIAANGLDLPAEPEARVIPPDPACVTDPIATLDLAAAGVSTVIWATGFAMDFRWLPDAAADPDGRPVHTRGVSAEPGIYFAGLPWQTRRGSSFIWGVWYDAKYVADHIAKQRAYALYRPDGGTDGTHSHP